MPPVHSPNSLVSHGSLGYRDIAYRDFTIPDAVFTGLQPTKLRYGISRVNPTNLMAPEL